MIGDGCEIGPDTRLVDCVVGDGAVVENTVGRDSEIGDGAHVGRTPTCAPGSSVPLRHRDGSLLHWHLSTSGRTAGVPMEKVTTKRMRSTRGAPTRRWPKRWPTTSASSSAIRTWCEFANGEIRPRFTESIRGSDVFIMQTHCGGDDRSINDSIMEQLIMIDTAYRASAKRITAVCPFYGYARQDRKAEGREPITARLVADLFKAAGAKRMVSIDLHSGQIQGFFEGPVDHLTAMPVLEQLRARTRERAVVIVVARRRAHQGGRAHGPAPRRPRRRPRVHLQAPSEGQRQLRPRPRK